MFVCFVEKQNTRYLSFVVLFLGVRFSRMYYSQIKCNKIYISFLETLPNHSHTLLNFSISDL